MKLLLGPLFLLLLTVPVFATQQFGEPYSLEVLPPQSKHLTDEQTGAKLTFLTDGTLESSALYFHERSWTQDGKVIVFMSQTSPKGGMGFLTETEELIRLRAADGTLLQRLTCAKLQPTIFGMAGNRALEISLEIRPSQDPRSKRSEVLAREREICKIDAGTCSLNESCDGAYLSLGGTDPLVPGKAAVFIIDTATGEAKRLCGMPEGTTTGPVYHVQWSITNPNLLSFASAPIRIWVVDIRDGIPWAPYRERPGELVTHEMWWVDDQITFCGGVNPKPQEDAHVKVLNPHTGEVRIVGEGAWWDASTPEELAKRNWWHCSGSPDGNWIIADNWHGTLMLFEGKTARPRLLTQGHRTYGKGLHPEPGWDPRSREVIFTSYRLENKPNVCIATVPDDWQQEVRQYGKRILTP